MQDICCVSRMYLWKKWTERLGIKSRAKQWFPRLNQTLALNEIKQDM